MEEKREKVNKEENVVESNNGEKKDEARKKVDKAVNDYVKDVKKRKNDSFIFTILGIGVSIIFFSLIIFILFKKYKSKRIEY